MRPISALGLLALAGFSAAQDQQQNNYPYTIDPQDVDQATRDTWCNDQKAACPLICLQQPGVTSQEPLTNDCDPDTLVYSCVCDNGVSPNITQFTQTLPYHICTQWVINCVDDCNGDSTCAYNCRADNTCGATDPPKPNNTATTTTMSATASQTGDSTVPVTGFLGATGTGSSQDGAASAMVDLSAGYGLAVVLAGVFAGFALL